MPNPLVHFLRATLDEIPGKNSSQIVLRGVLDPASLEWLKVDEYQREPLPLSSLSKLWEALKNGESLPDIELGMRGNDFDVSKNDTEFWLKGDVFIIDGQQRRNAALHILSLLPDLQVRMGAMVHFGTSREWERERFRILNLDRSKVSPNVLLRNMRHQSVSILTLYGLSHSESNFALFERVCWKQSQSKNELITARTLATVAGVLHAHRSPAFRNSISELVPALERQSGFVKLDRWRKNIVEFFDVVDEAFGVRNVTMRDISPQVRAGFLVQLALIFSDHQNFWREPNETELYVDSEMEKRLASFPLLDPTVANLVSTSSGGYGGGQPTLLYSMIRDHFNRGLSKNRLRNRRDETAANAPRRFSSDAPRSDAPDLEYPR